MTKNLPKCICRTCGDEIIPNVDARYTPATNADGTVGEHWRCHAPLEVSLAKLKDALNSRNFK